MGFLTDLVLQAAPSVVNGIGSIFGQKKANDTNIRLQHDQQAWNEKMWNMNNAYNAPIEQVKRLKEAGLNVGLMYAGGQGDVGNSSAPPQSVQPARVENVMHDSRLLGDTMAQVLDRLITKRQSDSVVFKNFADGINALSQSDLNKWQKKRYMFELEKVLPQEVSNMQQDYIVKQAQVNLINQQVDESVERVNQMKINGNYTAIQMELLDKEKHWFDKLKAATIYTMYQNANTAFYNAYTNRIRAVSQNETEKVLRDGYRLQNKLQKEFGRDSEQARMIGLQLDNWHKLVGTLKLGIETVDTFKRSLGNFGISKELKLGPFGTWGVNL